MSMYRSASTMKPLMTPWTRAAVLLGATLAACDDGVSPAPEPGPVTIAGTRSATGGLAVEGTNMARGIELAVKMLNEAGGIDGREVRIVLLDDESIHVKSIPLFLEASCLVGSFATRPLRRSLVLLGWIIRHRPRPGRASSGRRGRSIPAADAPSRCGPAG